MKGKVERIWENESESGRKYLAVKIGNARYTLWEPKYFGKFNEGDEVDFKYVNKGRYKNIVSIQSKHNGQKPKMLDMSPKDLQIVRMSCLKTASYVSNNFPDPEADIAERTDDILNVAKRFERYVTEIGEVDISAEYYTGEDDDGNGREKNE